jgi:hypothetical protein
MTALNVVPTILTDVQIGISQALETINTPKTLAAEFYGALINQINPPIPNPETVSDEDQVGDGTEFAKDVRLYYWGQTPLTIQCKLNTELAAILTKRFLAGTVTDSLVATGVYDHVALMQTRVQGILPQGSTIAAPLGGSDFIHSSMFVNSIQIQQALAGEPTFQAELMGTGYHRRVRDVYKVQTITITGAPAGGTFTLTFTLDGTSYTTAAIAYNASASTVATAIITAASLVAGDIVGSGGALPGTPVTLTIPVASNIYDDDFGAITADSSLLTGGTSPTVTPAPSVPVLVIPAPPTYHYMHGAALQAVCNDGSAIDLTGDGLLGHTITLNQNITPLRLPGNDFLKAGYVRSGAFPNFLRRGKRTADISIKLIMGQNLREYRWFRKNISITDLIFTHNGDKIGSTVYDHEYELTIPFSKARTLAGDAEGDLAAKTLTLLPTKDPVTLGIAKARIRNEVATLV